MKKLLPYIAALFVIALAILGTAFLAGNEIRSFTSFEDAEPVFIPAPEDPFV